MTPGRISSFAQVYESSHIFCVFGKKKISQTRGKIGTSPPLFVFDFLFLWFRSCSLVVENSNAGMHFCGHSLISVYIFRCDAMRCDATHCDAIRFDAMRCDAMRCDARRMTNWRKCMYSETKKIKIGGNSTKCHKKQNAPRCRDVEIRRDR